MTTIKNAPAFRNNPLVESVALYEFSATAAGVTVEMLEIPAAFRVTRVHIQFDDMGGAGLSMDVGYTAYGSTIADPDHFLDGTDVTTSAGTATWVPAADSKGKLFTSASKLTVLTIGGAFTGSLRVSMEGHFDYDSAS